MPRSLRALSTVPLAVAALALVLAACGSSGGDEAKETACNAVTDIEKQVDQLQSYTLADVTGEKLNANLEAIKSDLGEIKDSLPEIEGSLKSQLKEANEEFATTVKSTVSSVGESTSLAGAVTKLEAAFRELGRSYEQAFGSVSC